jgi:hypothetical protein
MRVRLAKAGVAIVGLAAAFLTASEPKQVTIADCSFVTSADEMRAREARARQDVAGRLGKFGGRRSASAGPPASVADIPRRGFIDAAIFGRLERAGVAPAPLASDAEFLRRVSLDLTGRIPSPDDVRAFLSDAAPDKRDAVIERLLASEEFTDRWTMWLGDLLQVTSASSNINRQPAGRNAFHRWLRAAVAGGKSYKDIAWEVVIAIGNTYDAETGAANFVLGAATPMGPIQDMFDTMLVKTATAFLGLAYYDCLLCHNGRGHLDQVSLWGSQATRREAQLMAAHFSRQRLNRYRAERGEPLYNSFDIRNLPAGVYNLNTDSGNRPPRTPVGSLRSLTPQYRLGGAPGPGVEWRDAFAAEMVADPMFARNIVNRLWRHFFSLGLVEPVDALDPARLDPANPPPEPWNLQATHPELLEELAAEFVRLNCNLRAFIRVLLQSSAYQLSSRYDGEWKYEYIPLFARHYPRRLEGEEIADAISAATGVPGNYRVNGWTEPVAWAVQLPEPAEPRGPAGNFMNAFLRGNRDTQQRGQGGSILQQLNLMNDAFVLNRIRLAASPQLQAAARLDSNDAVVERVFLLALSRPPSAAERERSAAFLHKAAAAGARSAAIEDLAWACINKVEFLFSY